jgi:hypothetical protein
MSFSSEADMILINTLSILSSIIWVVMYPYEICPSPVHENICEGYANIFNQMLFHVLRASSQTSTSPCISSPERPLKSTTLVKKVSISPSSSTGITELVSKCNASETGEDLLNILSPETTLKFTPESHVLTDSTSFGGNPKRMIPCTNERIPNVQLPFSHIQYQKGYSMHHYQFSIACRDRE